MDGSFIGESPFSWKFLIDTLEAEDPDYPRGKECVDIAASDISAGEGYLSKIYKTTISFSDSSSYQVVLKVPGLESIHQVFDDFSRDGGDKHDSSAIDSDTFVVDVHNRECDFYNLFASKCGAPLLKTYLAQRIVKPQQHGCILMESAVGKATTGSFLKSYTREMIFTIAEKLALMTKFSLLNPLGGRFEFEFYDHGNVGPMIPPMLKKLREFNEEWFGAAVDKLQKYLSNEAFLKYLVVGHYKDVALPGVLVHGDLWSNNIFWSENEEHLVAFIDWQLMHEGSMTFDLARILVVCTDAEIRRECTEPAYRHYYDTLKELMEKEGNTLTFDFDTMMKDARVTMLSQMGDLLSMVPFCCSHMEKEDSRIQKVLLRAKAALEDIGGYLERIERRSEFVQ